MYYVYALYSRMHNKIYIGMTVNIYSRLASHNHEKNKGWSLKYRPWEVNYTESILTKRDAIKRERQLKNAIGRSFIRTLIPK